jgi:hypothetical protein
MALGAGRAGLWLGLALLLSSHTCVWRAGADFTMLPVQEQDVAQAAQDFADRLGNWSCEVLRTGGPLCAVPGMSEVYDTLLTGPAAALRFGAPAGATLKHGLSANNDACCWAAACAEANGYTEMEMDPLEDVIKQDLLVQLSDAFGGMDAALWGMQADITRFVIERLRIDSLTKVNYSAIPDYDASHPHWKEDLKTNILEGTNFFEPVGRQSTLQYPVFVDR